MRHRPHLRGFLSWLIVLVGLAVAGGRLVTPGDLDAQEPVIVDPTVLPNAEVVDGVTHTIEHYVGSVTERTVSSQLAALRVPIDPNDRISAFPDPALGLGSQLTVRRASRLTIEDAGEQREITTWRATVGAVLAEAQIAVGDKDEVNIDKEDTIVDKMTIEITRVAETEIAETEGISFRTVTTDDPAMERGERRTVTRGQAGVRTKTYRVRRENGVQVEKTLLSSEVTREPTTEQITIGTHVTLYGNGIATWYDLRHGYGAASNTLPYGTRVRVVNTANGKSVDVTIDDHGIQGRAIIDLDAEAFEEIASLGQGVASVRLEKISN